MDLSKLELFDPEVREEIIRAINSYSDDLRKLGLIREKYIRASADFCNSRAKLLALYNKAEKLYKEKDDEIFKNAANNNGDGGQ